MNRRIHTVIILSASVAPWALPAADQNAISVKQTYQDSQVSAGKGGRAPATTQILYHNGPIMLGTNTLYIIYYGQFTDNTPSIINGFFAAVGGSPNYNVNTTYYDGQNRYISNSLSFSSVKNVYYDSYSVGKNIGSNGIEKIVQNAINGQHLPLSATAIYSVITSPDVTGSELNNLCAFHWNMTVNGTNVIYAALPDFSGSALNACSGNIATFHDTTSPNGNVGADMVLDSFMHELSESVTDPFGNAWYTKRGEENGDLCNFNYGKTAIAPNGSHYNTYLKGSYYLVQTIWQNTGAGFCANGL